MAQQCFIEPSGVAFRSCLGHSEGTAQLVLVGRDKTQGRGCLCAGGAGQGEAEREGAGKAGEISGRGLLPPSRLPLGWLGEPRVSSPWRG